MNILIEAYRNILQQYTSMSLQYPTWMMLIMVGLIIVGVIVAFSNKNKHNLLVWILPVILFPVFGTLAAVLCAIALAVIKKKTWFVPGRCFVNKGRVVFIAIFTAAAIGIVYFSKDKLPYINEAFVAGTAMLCLFLSYFRTMRRYSLEARFLHISKLNEQLTENDIEKDDYVYHTAPSYLLPAVEDVVKIKDSFFEGYARNFNGDWQFVAEGVNERFVFDSYTEEEFRARFDTESAHYIKKGIVEITAYMWFCSDMYGVVVRNNHADKPDITADRQYMEYDSTSVREAVLYRCQQSPKGLIVETAELAAAIFAFVTPLGAWLHNIALTWLDSLLNMLF